MNHPTLPRGHHIKLIRLFTVQGSWPERWFEPEISSMLHLPSKLGLYLPRWVISKFSERLMKLAAALPSNSWHRAIQILSLKGKSAASTRSVKSQNQYIQILCNNYSSVFLSRALSEGLSKCLAETLTVQNNKNCSSLIPLPNVHQ